MDMAIYLTRHQVAERLRLSIETVKWLRANSKMPEPDMYVDNKPMWKASTIDRWDAGRRKWDEGRRKRHEDRHASNPESVEP